MIEGHPLPIPCSMGTPMIRNIQPWRHEDNGLGVNWHCQIYHSLDTGNLANLSLKYAG